MTMQILPGALGESFILIICNGCGNDTSEWDTAKLVADGWWSPNFDDPDDKQYCPDCAKCAEAEWNEPIPIPEKW